MYIYIYICIYKYTNSPVQKPHCGCPPGTEAVNLWLAGAHGLLGAREAVQPEEGGLPEP